MAGAGEGARGWGGSGELCPPPPGMAAGQQRSCLPPRLAPAPAAPPRDAAAASGRDAARLARVPRSSGAPTLIPSPSPGPTAPSGVKRAARFYFKPPPTPPTLHQLPHGAGRGCAEPCKGSAPPPPAPHPLAVPELSATWHGQGRGARTQKSSSFQPTGAGGGEGEEAAAPGDGFRGTPARASAAGGAGGGIGGAGVPGAPRARGHADGLALLPALEAVAAAPAAPVPEERAAPGLLEEPLGRVGAARPRVPRLQAGGCKAGCDPKVGGGGFIPFLQGNPPLRPAQCTAGTSWLHPPGSQPPKTLLTPRRVALAGSTGTCPGWAQRQPRGLWVPSWGVGGDGRPPTPPSPTGAHAGVDAVPLGAKTVGVAPAAAVPEALAGPRVPPVVPAQREVGAGGAGVLVQGAQPGHGHRPPALPGAGGCRGQLDGGRGGGLGGPGRGDRCQPTRDVLGGEGGGRGGAAPPGGGPGAAHSLRWGPWGWLSGAGTGGRRHLGAPWGAGVLAALRCNAEEVTEK